MRTVELVPGLVRLIDQRRLPGEVQVLECSNHRMVAEAIRTLAVRGAPAIGISAAAGLALAARELSAGSPQAFWPGLEQAARDLQATRPTAVNLFWAIEQAMHRARLQSNSKPAEVAAVLWRLAQEMADQDVATNRRMAALGQELIAPGNGVITHCNTGALATVDYGTALGVIRAAHEAGKRVHVFVSETRPVLQGARLTAWECIQHGIPATLITDNMAAHFMRLGRIQIAFVGADRIAANGDTANKIGTYGLAILCREHAIPFFVVAPTSTVDLAISSGDEIEIEERDRDEVTHIGGLRVAPEGIGVANPAFDVTPHRYITGIVTERGIVYPPFGQGLKRAVAEGRQPEGSEGLA